MSRYFEDIAIGEAVELGSHRFTVEEIMRFAERYDPQVFHIDEAAAAASHFGSIIASGWHTAAVWMKLMIAHRQRARADGPAVQAERGARVGPSPGLRELTWLKPVRAGDTVSYSSVVAEKRELRSRPEWGLVVSRNEGINQDGDLVIRFLGQVLVERRPSSDKS